MRFWDTSGLIPLVIAEKRAARSKVWLREDSEVMVWTLTRVELLSALTRRRREKPESSAALLVARRDFLRAWDGWSEVTAVDLTRRHAERLVEAHTLRAADALQLGAAWNAAEEDPGSLEFVTLDRNLATAAKREGFAVLGP